MKGNIKSQSAKTQVYTYPLQAPGIPKLYGTAVTRIQEIVPEKRKRYILRSKKIKSNLRPGDTAVLVFRTQGGSIVFMRDSNHILIQGLTIYSSPAANFVALNTSQLTIRACNVLIKKGRWISSNADGVHIQSSRGDINIDKNNFEGLGDDGVNLYTKAFYTKKDSYGYFLWKNVYISKMLKSDDTLYIFNWQQGEIRKTKITKISRKGKKIYLSFNPQLTIKPEERIYDMNLVSNHFRITNNTFRNSRRFGLLLKAHHGVIRGNRFQNLGGSAIVMKNSNPKHFNEGLNCEDISLTDNIFGKCGFGKGRDKPIIDISMDSGGKNPFIAFHKNVSIKNNRFKKINLNISNLENVILFLYQ